MRRLITFVFAATVGTGFWLLTQEGNKQELGDLAYEKHRAQKEKAVAQTQISDLPQNPARSEIGRINKSEDRSFLQWPVESFLEEEKGIRPFTEWAKTPNFREVKNILPPIEGVNPPASATLVDEKLLENGGIVSLGFGAYLHVPEKALVDAQGNPIQEPVKISYCPLSDPIDIYLSGVPMTYDSAGTTEAFRTAGMVRLEAETYSGKKVMLKEGEQMRLDMPTVVKTDDFNFYTFEEGSGKWVFNRPAPPARPAIDLVLDTLQIKFPFDATPFSEKFSDMKYHYLTNSQVKKRKDKLLTRLTLNSMERGMREALYYSRYTNTNLIKLNPHSAIIGYTDDFKPIREIQYKIGLTAKGFDYFKELRHFRGFSFVTEEVKNVQEFYKKYRTNRRFHDIRIEYSKGDDYCTLVLKDEKEIIRMKARVTSGDRAKFSDVSKLRFFMAYFRYSLDLKKKEKTHDELILKEKRQYVSERNAGGRFGFYNQTNYRQINIPGFATFNCDQIARMVSPMLVATKFLREDQSKIVPDQIMVCDKVVGASFYFYPQIQAKCSKNGFAFALINAGGKTYYLPAKEKVAHPDRQVFVLKELPEIETAQELRAVLLGD